MASRVVARYRNQNPLFVTLLNGGVVFSTLLMMEIERQAPDFCPEVCYMNIETYGYGQSAGEPIVTQPLPPSARTEGRLVVVLDELLDSGASTAKAEEYLRGLGATDVELVVLLQKQRERKVWQNATLYMLDAPDAWLCGFGLNGAPGRPPESYRFAGFLAVAQTDD